MIEFFEITKSFKPDFWKDSFIALDKLSFKIDEGKTVGFLGANGAGKTTAMRILMGFSRADSGTIHFSKNLGSKKDEILKNIGFLPERPYFNPNLNGREFITYLAKLSGLKSSSIKGRSEYWAQRFKIDHALDRKIKTYSKGMMQRLGFCTALIHEPKFVILDEPLSGLDPLGRKELKEVIKEVNAQGTTIFFSSHIVSDVEEVCEKVIFLDQGKLIHEGSIESIIKGAPVSDYELLVEKDANIIIDSLDVKNLNKLSNALSFQVSPDAVDEVLKVLVDNNIKVYSVRPGLMSLEQVLYEARKRETDNE